MRNLLLTLKYDGTCYHGWQVQKNALSVQEKLQDAIEIVFQKREDIIGCSRTDAGVHANMYCCNFHTDKPLPIWKIIAALNMNLPNDIAVADCKEVPEDFHARYSCQRKEYVYKTLHSAVRDPFLDRYAYHYRYPLDVELLNEAAKEFVGEYDFSAFCSSKSKVGHTVRHVYRFDVVREGDLVLFKVEADGFLYNMVRIMVGTLLRIAQGKIKKNDLKGIIASKQRILAGPTAPAHGLYLNNIVY